MHLPCVAFCIFADTALIAAGQPRNDTCCILRDKDDLRQSTFPIIRSREHVEYKIHGHQWSKCYVYGSFQRILVTGAQTQNPG